MSPEGWIAIVGIIVTVLLAIAGALLAHVRHDERREARLSQVEKEIGSHELGLRGTVHEHGNALNWLSGCVWYLAHKIGIELPKRDKS